MLWRLTPQTPLLCSTASGRKAHPETWLFVSRRAGLWLPRAKQPRPFAFWQRTCSFMRTSGSPTISGALEGDRLPQSIPKMSILLERDRAPGCNAPTGKNCTRSNIRNWTNVSILLSPSSMHTSKTQNRNLSIRQQRQRSISIREMEWLGRIWAAVLFRC